MSYSWINRFNGIETDGPFKTIQAAKEHAASTYIGIQHGLAFDIAIIDDDMQVVESGHIKKGKWIDGKFKWIDGKYTAKEGEPGYATFGFAEREKHATT